MKILEWIVSIAVGLLLAGLTFVYFSPDYGMYVVRSESMKPTINMGDMVINGPLDGPFSEKVKPGTIISYQNGLSLVTHRVLLVDGDTLLTKGDAVEDPDPQTIALSQIKGLYLFKIPKLGYLSAFMHTKLGWFLVIILPAILLEAFIVKEILKEALSRTPTEIGRK